MKEILKYIETGISIDGNPKDGYKVFTIPTQHLNFCLKYPETIIGADESKLMVQYMIDNNITPVVDCFLVSRMDNYYKLDSNVFVRFKDIVKDFNDMIPVDDNKNYYL